MCGSWGIVDNCGLLCHYFAADRYFAADCACPPPLRLPFCGWLQITQAWGLPIPVLLYCNQKCTKRKLPAWKTSGHFSIAFLKRNHFSNLHITKHYSNYQRNYTQLPGTKFQTIPSSTEICYLNRQTQFWKPLEQLKKTGIAIFAKHTTNDSVLLLCSLGAKGIFLIAHH